ncbi:hypothetical protein ACWDE9_27700 [Streptomyces olivaceoviridis]
MATGTEPQQNSGGVRTRTRAAIAAPHLRTDRWWLAPAATLINAEHKSVTRDLCSYPSVSRYDGHGDPAVASSFRCVLPSRH